VYRIWLVCCFLRQRVAFLILLTRNPAEVDLPSQPTQLIKQFSGLDGDCEVESFADTPFAVELIDDQVGISMDRHSSWRAGTQVFQDASDTGIFRHVVGHCLAPAHHAMLSQEDGTIFTPDHDSEAGSSSGIDRFAGAIEPGKIVIQSYLSFPLSSRSSIGRMGELQDMNQSFLQAHVWPK